MKYKNQVQHMDCLEFLKLLQDNSIDSCVTDPPYGLQFMGVGWDRLDRRVAAVTGRDARAKQSFDTEGGHHHGTSPQDYARTRITEGRRMQEWHYQWAILLFQKLKPGAHALVFSGTRTYHRLACAMEDAGFEIRDQVHWLYGSGFPKGQNIAKTIDKREGLEGIPVDKSDIPKRNRREKHTDFRSGRFHRADGDHENMEHISTLPESDLAKQWTGWNTQLKPAHEPIVLARKPVSESSIVDNVLMHGTGAMNIDANRVSVNPEVDDMDREVSRKPRVSQTWEEGSGFKNEDNPRTGVLPSGRYPANLILSHHPDCKLIQEGESKIVPLKTDRKSQKLGRYGIYGKYCPDSDNDKDYDFDAGTPEIWNCVDGCPVRIINEQSGFTISRPDKRNGEEVQSRGIFGQGFIRKPSSHHDSGGAARFFYCSKPSITERNRGLMGDRNIHITVKPLELMRWLVRLITPPGGVVIDPFLGSGTTAIAAENEGHDWLGCDINEEYVEIAKLRIKALGGKQSTLEEFM